MLHLAWNPDAWVDYTEWQLEDRKTLKRINLLIKDIMRNGPSVGIGKPEPLRYRPAWSRHIDDTNRLVYYIENDDLIILSCKGHYDDK